MSYSEITSVIVSHFYDDQSKTDFIITKREDESNLCVEIENNCESIRLPLESWEMIRDQVDLFFGLGGE